MANGLRHGYLIGHERKRHGGGIGRLRFQHIGINGAPVEPRRCAGFHPPQRQRAAFFGQGIKSFRQGDGGCFAVPTGGNALRANMHNAVEKCAGGQHHGRSANSRAVRRHNTDAAAFFNQHIIDRPSQNIEIIRRRNRRLHGRAIELAVGLCARSMHGRPFAPIEQAKLDA
ncbi:MAG: Uncharacterised protein [Alphaproteobacteria bacterium]|nr:MAG: Uncharacterised protein [Alphaproteobacteria bacterium]